MFSAFTTANCWQVEGSINIVLIILEIHSPHFPLECALRLPIETRCDAITKQTWLAVEKTSNGNNYISARINAVFKNRFRGNN